MSSFGSKTVKKSIFWTYPLLIIGFILLGSLFWKIGWHRIAENLLVLGWGTIPIFLCSLLVAIFSTCSWNEFLKKSKGVVAWKTVFMAKLAGEAVNTLNPLGWGAGDPLRVYLLKRFIPIPEATASVVIDRTLNSVALVIFMIIGVGISFLSFNFPVSYQVGFVISLVFMVWMTLYWYKKQKEGLFEFLIHFLQKIKIKKEWSPETLSKVKETDRLISQFYREDKNGFWISLFLQFGTRLLGVAEIYLSAYFMNYPLGWIACYLLLSVTVIINMIFVFIPGSVGVLEGSYAILFHLFQKDPAIGTSIQFIRRIRMLLWSVVGMIYLYFFKKKPLQIKENI